MQGQSLLLPVSGILLGIQHVALDIMVIVLMIQTIVTGKAEFCSLQDNLTESSNKSMNNSSLQ
jgi:hypothetical protein